MTKFGFINIDKKSGDNSSRPVNILKRITGEPCGHMGTLDPLASGVLPIGVGRASRLFDYFLQKRKTYVATFDFGKNSDTLDSTGTFDVLDGRIPTQEEIENVLPLHIGSIDQVPPLYSAKSVDGVRAYDLARRGIQVELKPKRVEIYSIKLLERVSLSEYSFEIECGGGTYIRSIARDLAASLSTCAVMSALRRTRSGIFDESSAVDIAKITPENVEEFIIPTEEVLPFPCFRPNDFQAHKLFNGVLLRVQIEEGLYKVYDLNGDFYGIGEVKEGGMRIITKLC